MVNCVVEADRGEEPLPLNYFICICVHVYAGAHISTCVYWSKVNVRVHSPPLSSQCL